ncbi:hypothetical protein HCN44_008991 [Aphidius gifuensis]|uniref:Odorant-binding protein n=1 Tax=Aphidius gifuensis TaxID=684658 RepID=A0A834XQL2_APHGI|nr:hypothetical protein HCN44_008991 [Aphidius gifuensis]
MDACCGTSRGIRKQGGSSSSFSCQPDCTQPEPDELDNDESDNDKYETPIENQSQATTTIDLQVIEMVLLSALISDPIQQLFFFDKIREYKPKSSGGKMVDSTPETQRQLKAELERIAAQYVGGPGID